MFPENWRSVAASAAMRLFSAFLPVLAVILGLWPVRGQEALPPGVTPRPLPVSTTPADPAADAPSEVEAEIPDGVEEVAHLEEKSKRKIIRGSVGSRRNARTLTLSIPGPRGLITDRNGQPMAQNRVAYHFALEFPLRETLPDAEVLDWAGKRIAHAGTLLESEITLSDKRILEHYKDRRWMPLQFATLLDEEQASGLRDRLIRGLILHPVYCRYYPEKETAAHIIGYVRSTGKLPTGPINRGDPLFEWTSGASGLEHFFDNELTGKPGLKRVIFDSDGSRMLDTQEKRPEVGNTVVTTLNLKWQKHAEEVLAKSCKRGAFVVLDIQTGDVLVLASRPSYDINVWIPSITQTDLDALNNDPATPMYGRAFQSKYPPASTFKPVVALAALTDGVVGPDTLINSPAVLKIGNRTFRNHSKNNAGPINVVSALKISNNVWFYQVGIKTKAHSFLSMSRRLGFGSTTGLPLYGETDGLVPSDRYMIDTLGRPTTDGDTANWAIGQGAVSASPLQMAQCMAGIANGQVLPKLRLVMQVQDATGGVLMAPEPGARNTINADPEAVALVQQGMYEVVHGAYGTGQRAAVDFCEIAGKTGTGQWVKDRNLAWFTGFLPYENPRFAFAALYEGMPGEKVSGGRNAAPMIPRFFNPLSDEIKEILTPPSKALVIVEEVEAPEEGVLTALPVEPLELEGYEGKIPARAIPVEEDEWDVPPPPQEAAPVEVDVPEFEESEVSRALPVEEDEAEDGSQFERSASPEGPGVPEGPGSP